MVTFSIAGQYPYVLIPELKPILTNEHGFIWCYPDGFQTDDQSYEQSVPRLTLQPQHDNRHLRPSS